MKPTNNIKTLDDAIEALIDLYVAMNVEMLYEEECKKHNLNPKIDKFKSKHLKDELNVKEKNALREYLLRFKSKEEKTAFLKREISTILENDSQSNLLPFIQYSQILIEKIEALNDEKVIMSNLKKQLKWKEIYEDKDKEDNNISYGDFLEKQEQKQEQKSTLDINGYKIIRKTDYETSKQVQKKSNNIRRALKVDSKEEKLSKYELQIENNPTSINFFGETKLWKNLQDSNNEKYLYAVMSAIEKAKIAEREHIGRITLLDSELDTFVTQYDDNLEKAVKDLVEREKQAEELKENVAEITKQNKEGIEH